MGLKEDIKAHYCDKNGLVSPYYQEDPTKNSWASGNGLIYTAYYAAILQELGQLKLNDKQDISRAIRTCRVEYGLYSRASGHPDQEAVDDYLGLAAAAALCNAYLAREIYHYGKHSVPISPYLKTLKYGSLLNFLFGWIKVRFVYNNLHPGVFTPESWIGRQQQIIAALEYARGVTPPLLRRLWFTITILTSFSKEHTHPWMLSYLLLVAKGDNDWLYKLWRWKLKAMRGSLKNVFTEYFGENHPLTRYCPL